MLQLLILQWLPNHDKGANVLLVKVDFHDIRIIEPLSELFNGVKLSQCCLYTSRRYSYNYVFIAIAIISI